MVTVAGKFKGKPRDERWYGTMDNPPPAWLADLSDRVLALLSAEAPLQSIGCHFHRVDDVWELTLFAGATETVGGSRDGAWSDPPFSVDLLGLPACFDEIHGMWWQTQAVGSEDDLGNHLSVEGLVAGQKVWLRIKSHAPDRFGPAHQLLSTDQRTVDLW